MSRIKKRGLDYFPLDIDFLQNRLVRRIMKREGDGALATLVSAFSCIYGGEGYYVLTDAFLLRRYLRQPLSPDRGGRKAYSYTCR